MQHRNAFGASILLRATAFCFALLGAAGCSRPAEKELQAVSVQPKESCIDCHRKRQPGLLAQWEAGRHAREKVTCEDCHGDDHDAMFAAEGKVDAATCQECHIDQTAEFMRSVHGRARKDALKNARLMAQIPAMQRRGCLTCHSTGGRRGGSCNGCHGAHRFSAAEAREPEACGICHCGPDHPQIEAFERSKHGVAYKVSRDEKIAPTCAGCHMTGTHDVSSGITIGRAASGAVLDGETPPTPMRKFDAQYVKENRELMLTRCDPCHTRRLSRKALEDADEIKREADRLLAEAVRILVGLDRDRLLDPMPDERIAHPTKGYTLVLGGPQLYEDHSEPERIFFDISKFSHSITFKGAYHFSPDHTHWLGLARMKASLEQLRAEERRLRAGAKEKR